MRAAAVAGDDVGRRGARAPSREQPSMAGARSSRGVSTHEPYVYSDAGDVRVAVVDYGCKRSILRRLAGAGAAVTVFPHDVDADELAELRRRRCSRTGPATRSRSRDEVADGARAARPRAGARHLPRPPAARARDRPRDVQAPVRPPRREPPGARARDAAACSSRARTTASPSRRPTTREATHVSLYDGTVEGLDYPELRARSVQFHPEAGPGPARRLADPRRAGSRRCAVAASARPRARSA